MVEVKEKEEGDDFSFNYDLITLLGFKLIWFKIEGEC